MFIFRRGNNWWVGYTENGKRKSRPLHKYLHLSFPIKEKYLAQQLLAQIRVSELKRKLEIDEDFCMISLVEFYREYSRYCDRRKTRESSRSDAYRHKKWLGFLKREKVDSPAKISKQLMHKFISELDEEISNATINRYVVFVRASLNWGVRMGYLRENPLLDFPRLPETPRTSHRRKERAIKNSEHGIPISTTEREYIFRKEGQMWTIQYESDPLHLQDVMGLRLIAYLLRNPGRYFHAAELRALAMGQIETLPLGSAGEIADERAIRDYKSRHDHLTRELEEATANDDQRRMASISKEMKFLEQEIAHSAGLRGKPRKGISEAERARLAVTVAMLRSMDKVKKLNLHLWQHLENCIKRGTFLIYLPDRNISWKT